MVSAIHESNDVTTLIWPNALIGPDGRFEFTNLSPGIVTLYPVKRGKRRVRPRSATAEGRQTLMMRLLINIASVPMLVLVTASCEKAPTGPSPNVTPGITTDYTLLADSSVVARGARLSVSWTVTYSWSTLDWIGLFKLQEPNTNWENNWWQYTDGAASGTFSLDAPSQPGEYEFRFFPDNGIVEVARSAPVTVR